MGDYRARAGEALAGFAKLGSREDADRTQAWAQSLADEWEAEKRRLEAQLAGAVEALERIATTGVDGSRGALSGYRYREMAQKALVNLKRR